MLLSGGHGKKFTIVPSPRLLILPVEAVLAHALVASVILCADGKVKLVLKSSDGWFEQATPMG
jgi:hypothetical protein